MFAVGRKSVLFVKHSFLVWYCNSLCALKIKNKQSKVLLNLLLFINKINSKFIFVIHG